MKYLIAIFSLFLLGCNTSNVRTLKKCNGDNYCYCEPCKINCSDCKCK